MFRQILFVLFVLAVAGPLRSEVEAQERWDPPDAALLAQARAILAEVPLIDTHNDLVYSIQEVLAGDAGRVDLNETAPRLSADIPRLRQGQVGAQFWSAYVAVDSMRTGASLRHALRSIDMVYRIVERYPDDLEFATTADDIERIHREGLRIASLIGFEGGHAIQNSLSALRMFHQLGVRYMTLTHSATNDWADATTDYPIHNGLSELGERIVREMNRIGMFVDISHVSAEAMKDALRVTEAPVIFSHSSSRALNPHPRNVPDDVLALMPANGGVVMVNFIADFIAPDGPAWVEARLAEAERLRAELNDVAEIDRRLAAWDQRNPKPRGTVADVANHIDNIRDVAGIDHIGIGSDYYTDAPDAMSVGLEDLTTYPHLFAELLSRGYTEGELKKIAGLNLLRAMHGMEETAARLRAEGRLVPYDRYGR